MVWGKFVEPGITRHRNVGILDMVVTMKISRIVRRVYNACINVSVEFVLVWSLSTGMLNKTGAGMVIVHLRLE